MRKLILRGITHPGQYELQPGLNRIGRNPTNDFRVSDASVSSFHCEITMTEDSVLVRDLGSTNGTLIDQSPVQEGALNPGQTLQLGFAEFKLEAEAETPAASSLLDRLLPDGSPACVHHPEIPAGWRCPKCLDLLCESCVRTLQRVGGQPLVLCPKCSVQCEMIATPTTGRAARANSSLLGRLTQTLKIKIR